MLGMRRIWVLAPVWRQWGGEEAVPVPTLAAAAAAAAEAETVAAETETAVEGVVPA